MNAKRALKSSEKDTIWTATKVQFLYRHRNGRYYVRTFAGSKEKWASLKTSLLSVAKNRMKEHVDASERLKVSGEATVASGRLTFGEALTTYQKRLVHAAIRPNTKAFREAGIKLVLRTWPNIEELNVRKLTSRAVEEWLGKFCADAKPYVPTGAKSPAKTSTGASATTIKCALDALRHVLDIAVDAGHLYANPAKNTTVVAAAKNHLKRARRQKSEKGTLTLPTKDEFRKLADVVRNFGVGESRAAADYIEFIAYCGARKTEAWNVLWSDADFDRELIHLRVTKNGEARFVPMINEMKVLLEKMRAERPAAAPSDRILLVKECQGFINSACKKLAIPRFTTHALRHLFGTVCLEAGVDVRTVAKWLGHKDNGALLLKIYSHVRKEHESAMIGLVRFNSPP